MKIPKNPPSQREMIAQIGGDRLLECMEAVDSPTVDGKYLQWDELRHRTPPDDLTLVEWWFGLKFKRMLRKWFPIRDLKGNRFSCVMLDSMQETLHFIDLNAGGTVQMAEVVTDADTRGHYVVRSLMEEAITSSQLEGAATTREEAKAMIREGRDPRDRSERMILNNYQTMLRIGQVKDRPLTKDLVFELHRMVTDGTLDDPTAAGRFRQAGEYRVVGDEYGEETYHRPPPDDQLEARMAAMCDFANGKTPEDFVHPAIRSIILHFWLAYDHPFVDGNGRTARALFYWSMLHHGYWLFEYVSISNFILKAPVRYGLAFLHTETDDNDLTYFVVYHLEIINRAIKELHDYMRRRTRELREMDRELRGAALLNHRQRDLIRHALRHPGWRYTVETHKNSHGIVYQTARADLLDLSERGLMIKQKIGRAFVFVPVADLEKRLGGED